MGEMMMTPEQLAELRKAAIAATPGPWIKNTGTKAPSVRAATEASEIAKWIRICVAAHTRDGDTPQNLRAEANTDFIARANPYVVLQLLDKISAQQARIAELWQALADATESRKEAQRTLQQVQQQMQRAGVIATKDAYQRGVEAECVRSYQHMQKLEQDAARYRWLREQASIIRATEGNIKWEWESGEYGEPDHSLDRFIDSAMQSTWPEDASDYGSRIDVIGQNGNDGLHYPEGTP